MIKNLILCRALHPGACLSSFSFKEVHNSTGFLGPTFYSLPSSTKAALPSLTCFLSLTHTHGGL